MDKLTKALLCTRAGMLNSLNGATDTTFNVGNIAFVVCSFVILLGFIVPMGTERPDTVLGGRLCISSKWSISTGVRNLGTGLHCMDWWFRSHTSHFFNHHLVNTTILQTTFRVSSGLFSSKYAWLKLPQLSMPIMESACTFPSPPTTLSQPS